MHDALFWSKLEIPEDVRNEKTKVNLSETRISIPRRRDYLETRHFSLPLGDNDSSSNSEWNRQFGVVKMNEKDENWDACVYWCRTSKTNRFDRNVSRMMIMGIRTVMLFIRKFFISLQFIPIFISVTILFNEWNCCLMNGKSTTVYKNSTSPDNIPQTKKKIENVNMLMIIAKIETNNHFTYSYMLISNANTRFCNFCSSSLFLSKTNLMIKYNRLRLVC